MAGEQRRSPAERAALRATAVVEVAPDVPPDEDAADATPVAAPVLSGTFTQASAKSVKASRREA